MTYPIGIGSLARIAVFIAFLSAARAEYSFRPPTQKCLVETASQGCCPEEVMTHCEKSSAKAPRMLIGIGAQKSATSFMAYLLDRHPAFMKPFKKELSYFNDDSRDKFSLEEYLQHWNQSQTNYQDPVYYEYTPDYMPDAFVPCRMRAVIPNTKFLVILRSPVDRFYSHVNMERHFCRNPNMMKEFGVREDEVCQGRYAASQSLHDLMKIHSRDLEAVGCTFRDGNDSRSWMDCQDQYDGLKLNRLGKGFYGAQLAWWMEFFPPERFLILDAKEVMEDAENILQRVARFALGNDEAGAIKTPILNTCPRNTFVYGGEEDLGSTLERLSKLYAQPNIDLQLFLSDVYPMDSDLVSPGIGAEVSRHTDWSKLPRQSVFSSVFHDGVVNGIWNFFSCNITWKKYRGYIFLVILLGMLLWLLNFWKTMHQRKRKGLGAAKTV